MVPTGIEFEWEGDRLDSQGRAGGKLVVGDLGTTEGAGGLMEKFDVLAEIPFVIRKGLAAVTGTKPYIFQVSRNHTLRDIFNSRLVSESIGPRSEARREDNPGQRLAVQRGQLRFRVAHSRLGISGVIMSSRLIMICIDVTSAFRSGLRPTRPTEA